MNFSVQDITEKTHHQDIGSEFIIKKNQTIQWQHQLWHQLDGILQQCQALPIPKLTIDRNDLCMILLDFCAFSHCFLIYFQIPILEF